MNRLAISIALTALTGCATVTDVVPTGANSFMVGAHGIDGNGSGAAQKAIALKSANAYCRTSGRQLQVIDARTEEPLFGKPPSAEVNFKCTD